MCQVDGCTRKVQARSLCHAHYQALRSEQLARGTWQRTSRWANYEPPPPHMPMGDCAAYGCLYKATRVGLCDFHFGRLDAYCSAFDATVRVTTGS